MLSDFDKALAFVLPIEGGYINRKGDKGGPTNHGITQHTYDAWNDSHAKKRVDVKYIEMREVSNIYYKEYWSPLVPLNLESKVMIVAFDLAVNSGVGIAKDYVERAHNDLFTLLALRLRRYDHIATLPEQAQFHEGWINRLKALCKLVGINFHDVEIKEAHLPL